MPRRFIAAAILAALIPLPVLPGPVHGQTTPGVPTGFVADAGADFSAMRAAGASAVKLVADWAAIEPRAWEVFLEHARSGGRGRSPGRPGDRPLDKKRRTPQRHRCE